MTHHRRPASTASRTTQYIPNKLICAHRSAQSILQLTSSIITFISSRTIHEQGKLTYHPYRPSLPSSTMTQSTILTWRGHIDHGNWYMVYWSRGMNTCFCLHQHMSRRHVQYLFD